MAKDGNTPSLVYYELDGADAVGRELTITLGNGLHEYRDYDRASGHLSSIQTDPGMGAAIQNLSFSHDEVGNVLTRTNANIGKNETFTYDDLNRLHTSQVGGLSTVTMGYSAAGRIESKTDVGSYIYSGGCGGGPMAVKSAAGKTYCYDAAGRMTSRGGSAITWYSYDLPNKIDNGSVSTEFTYGVDRARITQTRKVGSTPEATIRYIGQLLESETAGGTTTWRHYVSARGRVVAQVNRVDSTNTVQYLHRDHQGSVVEVTGSAGTLVQSLAFDPWGLRRNAATWAPLASPFGGTQPTERGYTGHEHLDNVELIHMNGRVQDPRLGLFVSADPLVQAPYHSQSHNRYSYVWNNPMTLIDPSGFTCEKLGDADCTEEDIERFKCMQLGDCVKTCGPGRSGSCDDEMTVGPAVSQDEFFRRLQQEREAIAESRREIQEMNESYAEQNERYAADMAALEGASNARMAALLDFAGSVAQGVDFLTAGPNEGIVIGTALKKGAAEFAKRAARAIPRLKAFERAGIETTEHFSNRLAGRAGRGITERNALDAYQNGRLYYNEATGNYVRHSSRTGVSVVTDAPSGGRAITVFEGNPSPGWNPVPWRPGQ